MGINCHILVEHPQGSELKNFCFNEAANVRWSSHDQWLRERIGVPDRNPECWEHLNNDDYERVFEAAKVLKMAISAHRDKLLEEEYFDIPIIERVDFGIGIEEASANMARLGEWIAYYEMAAGLVVLGHKVVCYGA